MKAVFIFKLKQFFILLIIFYANYSLTCGENEIEGCEQCGTDNDSNKCISCKDKYLLILDGANCLKCDDEFLGSKGCSGNCELNKSGRLVKCQENSCKEGFYEISPGYCAACSFLSEHCTKCSYLDENQSGEKVFKCLDCEDFYHLSDGLCLNNYNNCKKQLNESFCLECEEGFFLSKNGYCMGLGSHCIRGEYILSKDKVECLECEEQYFLDGYCKYCNENIPKYESNLRNCAKCKVENSQLKCEKAMDGYYINILKNIVDCGSYCKKCTFSSEEVNESPILKCIKCSDSYNVFLSKDGKCKNCIENEEERCGICSDEENAPCSYCFTKGYIQPNGKCKQCSDYFGEGCQSCSYSPYDGSIYCTSCMNGYFRGYDGKCKKCQNENEGDLIGCKNCVSFGKGFYCSECEDNYILFNGKCIVRDNTEFKSCLELENIGTEIDVIYSCIECISRAYIFAIKENNAKVCVEPSNYNDLGRCKLSRKESIGNYNYTCIECDEDYKIVLGYDKEIEKQACICKEGYYKDYNYYDSKSFGCTSCYNGNNCNTCHVDNNNVKCDSCLESYVISYPYCFSCPFQDYCLECTIKQNYEKECIKFKEPYFLDKELKVDNCDKYIDNCVQCSFSILDNETLKCDKCKDNHFLNKDGNCTLCYINEKIGPSCYSCTDDEKIKEIYPCQKCSDNYILTKEFTCAFCRLPKYGGLNCQKCGYINIDGIEKIGCIKCDINYILSEEEGKCFYNRDPENCYENGFYYDQNNQKRYGCLSCDINYCLSENNKCIAISLEGCLKSKIYNNKENCLLCKDGYSLNEENECDKIIPNSEEQKIEGCILYSYKYNNYGCIQCDSNYVTYGMYCIKIQDNQIMSKCKKYDFSNGIIYCSSCNENIYIPNFYGKMEVCGNTYFGICNELINLGDRINPKYSCGKCHYTNMTDENGIIKCIEFEYNTKCLEGTISTNYYNDIYKCTKCEKNFILSYDDYYDTYICKDIFIDYINPSIYDISFYESDNGIPTINGKCSDGYFTRNLNVCIKCDDETNGMPGCKGKCNFRINRKKKLKCEKDNCKENYFEIEPGICSLCSDILSGCKKCSYIENQETKIVFPIRKRNLICNECLNDHLLKNGICYSCNQTIKNCNKCAIKNNEIECLESNPGYYVNKDGKTENCKTNCNKCELISEGENEILKCTEATYGYYLDNNGKIQKCENNCNKCEFINEEGEGTGKIKCLETIDGYFINKYGKVKKCSDEIEGTIGCDLCEYNNNYECLSCLEGYELINNICKSYKELYNLDNCKSYYTVNSIYYCYSCTNDYLYVSNLKKCLSKTEETEYCSQAISIKKDEDIIYNCTKCINNNYINIKDSNGLFNCYHMNFVPKINSCLYYINKGTYNEPFFMCDQCKESYVATEYENGNSECNYIYGITSGCKKATYYYNHIGMYNGFNCTECKYNRKLVYDNITKSMICKDYYDYENPEPIIYPDLEIVDSTESLSSSKVSDKTDYIKPIKCEIEFCKKCNEIDPNICMECKSGYVINKMGNCYKRPKEIPDVVFKDIFRYALNGNSDFNGDKLFEFEFYLRGITSNDISSKHSFILMTIFNSESSLRALQDSKIIKAYCIYMDNIESQQSILKYIDYKCYSDKVNEDLSNYKMVNIKEGIYEDKDNLKSFNLENLVQKINDITKAQSIYNEAELNKYITFIVDDNYKKIIISNYDNNLTVYGITDKPLTENIIGKNSFFNVTDESFDFKIDAKNKNKASIIINTNTSKILEENKINSLTF